jgi:hypothetical protein
MIANQACRSEWLVIGDLSSAEFAGARTALAAQGTKIEYATTIEQACEQIDRQAGSPAWIVIVQSRPGLWSAADVESLSCRAPLARMVALLGSWCEGETRTGMPWPGVVRSYAHQWTPRFTRTLTEIDRGRASGAWFLPPTASEAERLGAESETELSHEPAARVTISSPDRAMAEMLAALCVRTGRQVTKVLPGAEISGDCDALILDMSSYGCEIEVAVAEVSRGRAAVPQASIILLLHFPRSGDVAQLQVAGATHVLGMPVLVEDLSTCLAVGMRDRTDQDPWDKSILLPRG